MPRAVPCAVPGAGGDRAVTVVEREGRRIAALVHDPAVADDPTLVSGAVAAAGLALENERLHAEVRAQLEELRASGAGWSRPVTRSDGAWNATCTTVPSSGCWR